MSDSSRPRPFVLAVDDEEHITELVALALGYNGFEVERVAVAGRHSPPSRSGDRTSSSWT